MPSCRSVCHYFIYMHMAQLPHCFYFHGHLSPRLKSVAWNKEVSCIQSMIFAQALLILKLCLRDICTSNSKCNKIFSVLSFLSFLKNVAWNKEVSCIQSMIFVQALLNLKLCLMDICTSCSKCNKIFSVLSFLASYR